MHLLLSWVILFTICALGSLLLSNDVILGVLVVRVIGEKIVLLSVNNALHDHSSLVSVS